MNLNIKQKRNSTSFPVFSHTFKHNIFLFSLKCAQNFSNNLCATDWNILKVSGMFFSFRHHDYHVKCAAGFSSHQGFNIDGFKISLKQQEFLNPCCLRTFGISIEIVLFSAYIHTNIDTYISRPEAQLKQRHSKNTCSSASTSSFGAL